MATSPVNHRLLAVAGNRRERRSSILARRLLIRGSSSALSRPTCLYKYLDVQQPPASVDFYCWMWMLGVAQSPSSLLATAPYAFVHTQKTPFFLSFWWKTCKALSSTFPDLPRPRNHSFLSFFWEITHFWVIARAKTKREARYTYIIRTTFPTYALIIRRLGLSIHLYLKLVS